MLLSKRRRGPNIFGSGNIIANEHFDLTVFENEEGYSMTGSRLILTCVLIKLKTGDDISIALLFSCKHGFLRDSNSSSKPDHLSIIQYTWVYNTHVKDFVAQCTFFDTETQKDTFVTTLFLK